MRIPQCAAPVFLLVVASLVVHGCGDDGDNIFLIPGSPEATPEPTGSISEMEPNDTVPQDLGQFQPGDRLQIVGSVSFNDNAAMDDEFDRFLLTATQAVVIRATITHSDDVDFDLSYLDPDEDIFLTEDCDSPSSPDICLFEIAAGQTVRLEVEAFSGGGLYTLEID